MFNGFQPEVFDFLWGIRFNNERQWFQDHKKEYEEYLYRPMQALAGKVAENYQLEGAVVKPSRIYRDVRYSGGIPYKDHLWFCIRQPEVFWSEHPSLYFQIEPEGGSCGFINYAPKAAVMQCHRNHMLAGDTTLQDLMGKILQNPRFEDKSISYKRPKPGYTEALGPYYNLKNCFVHCEIPAGDELFVPEFADFLVDCFRQLEPLYHYFRKLEQEVIGKEKG